MNNPENPAFAFPFVFIAGCALMYSPHRSSRFAGLSLSIAGLAGTSAMGPGDDGIVGSIVLLVAGFIVCLSISVYMHTKRRSTPKDGETVPCPQCGRPNGAKAPICPRCNTRLIVG